MAGIRLYDHLWPVVFWVFDGHQEDEDIDFYLTKLDELHQRQAPFSSITLMRKFNTQRRFLFKIASWMKANDHLTQKNSLTAAMVSASPVFRFVLSSLILLQPIKFPYLVCATREEAASWTKTKLVEKKLTLPEGIESFNPL